MIASGPRSDVGRRSGAPHRLRFVPALALMPCLLPAAALAVGDTPGPRPTGIGSVPVTPMHASAWFVHRADADTKLVTLVIFMEGTPGWHAKTTDFRWATGDTISTIDMNVGPTPVHVTYRADTRAVRILDREFALGRDNVFLVSGIDGPAPAVKGLGIRDLAFKPDDNPAVALPARDAVVRNALIGETPGRSARPAAKPQAPDVDALDRQGTELLRQGTPEDDRTAVELFRKAAARGHAGAQYRLGWCYEAGRGVGQDSPTANQWFLKAAKQGQVDAQFKLAWSYRLGRGTAADSAAALKWFIQAAESGDAQAQGTLGVMYATGSGAQVDAAQAFAWYLRSAGNGNPEAQGEIVRRYRDGDGVTKDLASAYQWLVVMRADPDFAAASDRQQIEELARSLESGLDEGSRARAIANAHEFCRAYTRRYLEKLGR